jgi:PAS domain S-box-containing protein
LITALRDSSGELVGFSKITRDLTERRRHEEDLRHSEERFRLMVEAVQDYAIFMLDPDGRVASWNAGAERIKGYAPSEIIGQHFSRFYPPDRIAAGWPEHELEMARKNGRFEDEGWRLRKDGSRFWANVVITAVHGPSGEVRGFTKVTRDLTERRRVETLEEEGRQINEFLAMLGHELRNPLGAIRVAGELLGHPASEAQRGKQLGIIQRQTRHLARLVDDLLDVARVTYGKVTLRLEPVALAEVLRTCFQSHEFAARKQQLSCSLQVDDEQLRVSGDRVRLEQVFGNLLSNAIKYTPRGGSVRVELSRVGDDAVVRVIDTGIGIAPGMLTTVFDLFSQAERGLDRSQGGMGLGLTLVRSLVRLHGGTADAFSRGDGRGSEFRVCLPLVANDAVAVSKPRPERKPVDARRIVIVEDNDDVRSMQEDLLRLAGHEVRSATTGPEGITTILEFRPDAAFIDLGLPGCDGFEVARSVRAASQSNVLLVAVSGYGQVQDRDEAHAAGFDVHLTKPVGLEDFVSSMARLGQSHASPNA